MGTPAHLFFYSVELGAFIDGVLTPNPRAPHVTLSASNFDELLRLVHVLVQLVQTAVTDTAVSEAYLDAEAAGLDMADPAAPDVITASINLAESVRGHLHRIRDAWGELTEP